MGVLDQHARVTHFGGLGFQVALLAPLRRGFLLRRGLARFPSSLSELHFGLRQGTEWGAKGSLNGALLLR